MGQRIVVSTVVLCVSLGASGQVVAQCPNPPDFVGCGTLIRGAECVLFQADAGGLFVLDDLGGFQVGDRVEVTGCLNPNCFTTCQQGDGCIENNTISDCPDPLGRCCFQGFIPEPLLCEVLTEAQCNALPAPVSWTEGENCENDPCNDLLGRCCFLGIVPEPILCDVLTLAECNALPSRLSWTVGLTCDDACEDDLFSGCGTLGPGPQGCILFHADSGESFALDNLGGFLPGARVWVTGLVDPQSLPCFPATTTGLNVVTIGECFEECGTLQFGPQGCPILVGNDQTSFLFIEHTDGFGSGERVWVQGCLNPNSLICPPFTQPGIEDNTIGLCFKGCGELIQGVECVLFQSDEGGLYQLDNLGAFQVGDRIEVTGCLNPQCVSFCFAPNGCIENNSIRPCAQCDCVGDVNGDGIVNGGDIAGFIRCLLGSPAIGDNCVCADINGDGLDHNDVPLFVALLLSNFDCGPTGACCVLSFNVTCFEDVASVCAAAGGTFQGPGTTCLGHEACCLADGSCLFIDRLCCVDINGAPQGPNSTCGGLGACCLDIDDGPLAFDACNLVDQICCENGGGVFQGVGTTCSIQACCLPNGFCQDADPVCCVASGGSPQGPNSVCLGVECPPEPNGACCFDTDNDGIPESCAVTNTVQCNNLSGTFQGPGSTCLGAGACCFGITGGSCVVLDAVCCDDILGTFQGFGTVCLGDGNGNGLDDACEGPLLCGPTPDGQGCAGHCPGPLPCVPTKIRFNSATGGYLIQACDCTVICHVQVPNAGSPPVCTSGCPNSDQTCELVVTPISANVADYECLCTPPSLEACCAAAVGVNCFEATPADCLAAGGVPQGQGTSCGGPGACCFDIDDGPLAFDACVVIDQTCCGESGGVFQGIGTTCTNEACCLPNGFCQEADRECCIASGGQPQGPGTSCTAAQCP